MTFPFPRSPAGWLATMALAASLCGACVDHAAPASSESAATPALTPAAPSTGAAPGTATGATTASSTDGDAGIPGPLERDAAELDAAMRRARARIDAGGAQVSAATRDELAAMEKRYEVVKQQLHDLGARVDERAVKVREETKTAADDLRRDLDKLADRITK